jgi:hypothetical protein
MMGIEVISSHCCFFEFELSKTLYFGTEGVVLPLSRIDMSRIYRMYVLVVNSHSFGHKLDTMQAPTNQ